MDFSWVKQLAEQSNQQEVDRQEQMKRMREERKQVGLATCPFVEKLFVLVQSYTDEFNKHCMFPNLRVVQSKLVKRSRSGEASDAEPDEVAYFSVSRRSYMYGIRGINGLVEFIEFPITDAYSAPAIKLDELGVQPSRRFEAEMDPQTKQITWTMSGRPLDGPLIISTVQQYFREFIERTNEPS